MRSGNKEGAALKRKLKKMDPVYDTVHHRKSNNISSSKGGKKYRLLTYEELPEYMKDNEFIRKYYRSEWPLKHALFSLFQWHNETLNVWSHLLGFILFLGLVIVNAVHLHQAVDLFGIFRSFQNGGAAAAAGRNMSLDSKPPLNLNLTHINHQAHHLNHPFSHSATAPRWPFYIYLAGSMFCLLSSTTCHLFSCHSRRLNLQLLRLDYAGITIMIISSFFPPIYYIFFCHPLWQIIYLAGISLLGAAAVITLLYPAASSAQCRPFRAALFSSLGLFGVVPAVHACVLNWSNPRRNVTLAYEGAMATSYLVGTAFYVSRVPERWGPGRFDLAGHSHQIFHVFVVLGALAHYGASLIFLEYRDIVGCH